MTIQRNSYIKIGLVAGFVLLLAMVMLQNRSVGVTFATGQGQGGLEMMIDSNVIYNGVFQPSLSWELKDLVPGVDHFFNFGDVKPGDTGTSTISIHIKKNPAYVCLDFLNLTDEENGVNEPESHVDNEAGGELADGLEFFAWFDDGDNHFEVGEEPIFGTSSQSAVVVLNDTTYPLADALNGEAFAKNSTHYVGVAWCAGDLQVDLNTASVSCDGEVLGNEAQTDSMSVDVRLRAVQANQQTGFLCEVPLEPCEFERGNNGHGNDEDHNDDSNPGASNDPDDDTDDDGLPPGFVKRLTGSTTSQGNPCREYGNNGHGNEEDHNDDSNPGASNDPDDDTDDDGFPPGQQTSQLGAAASVWYYPEPEPSVWQKVKKWGKSNKPST